MNGHSLKGLIYAAMFGAATAAGAYIIIPFPLVPITLQTFFLNLSAALLGGRLAALSQMVYLSLGIMGMPVFAGGKGGLGVLFGPTGGYLIGFVVASYLMGRVIGATKKESYWQNFLPMFLGMGIIYLFGITQLCLVAKLTLGKAFSVGLLPFLIGDVIKMAAAAMVAKKLRGRIEL